MTANIVVSKAPFLSPIREPVDAGRTVESIFGDYTGLARDHTRAFVNGYPVDDWNQEVVSGDLLTLHQVPSGLGLAANLAIAALAVSVATFFLFAPEEPEISDNEKRKRVKGDSNQNKAYEPIPYILGKRKIVPAYAANPYYEYRGKDQYYRMLLCVGYGPMDVTDVRIGEVPISSFGEVEVATVDWYNNSDTETLRDIWSRDVTQNNVQDELPREGSGWLSSFVPVGRGVTNVTFSYPRGLYWIKGDGNRANLCGSIQLQYQGGSGDWFTAARYFNKTAANEGAGPYRLYKEGGVLYRTGSTDQNWGDGEDNLFWYEEPVPSSYIVYDDGNGYVVLDAPEDYEVSSVSAWSKTNKFFTRSITFDPSLHGGPPTETTVTIRARNLSPGSSGRKPWTDTANLEFTQRNAPLSTGRFNELIGSPSGDYRPVIIALNIKATDQVSGNLDSVNVIAESVVPSVWANDWREWFGQALTPSSNPAELYRWVLQGPFNRARVANSRIRLEDLDAWRTRCVTDGWEASNYNNESAPLKSVLNNVAKTGRAEFAMRDGKFSVVQNIEKLIPTQIFTPKNSSGFSSKREFPDPSDGITVEFQNEDQDWELDEWTYYDPSILEADRIGQTDSLELWGVTNPALAQKHARFAYLEKRFRRETYELTTDIENLACARGDLVLVQNDIIDVGLGSGIVKSVGAGTFSIDETFGLVSGQSYGVRVRTVSSGTQFKQITATYDGAGQWSTGSAIEFIAGDLASYGVAGSETLDCIVVNVSPSVDLGASVTLVNAANEIYTEDGEPLPAYTTNLRPRPENQIPTAPEISAGVGPSNYLSAVVNVSVLDPDRLATVTRSYRLQYKIDSDIIEDPITGVIETDPGRPDGESSVWIDAPDIDARIGSVEVPIPLDVGNRLVFRAKARGTGNLISAWSDEYELVISSEPAANVNSFTVTEKVNTPKTPDGMFSTLVITVDEPPTDPYLYAIAEYRLPSQDEWQRVSKIGWQFPSVAEVQVLANGTQYEIRVRSVSVYGVENFYGLRQIVTTTNVLNPEYTEDNPFLVLPVPDVRGLELFEQGNDTEFGGRDAKFVWRRSTVGDWVEIGFEGLRGAGAGRLDQYFRDYQVEIWTDNQIVRTEQVYDPVYIYSFEKNAEDYRRVTGTVGAWRDFEIRVIERGRNNQVSANPAKLSVANTAPEPLAALSVVPGFSVIEISYLRPDDLDFAGVDIWVSQTQGFDPNAIDPTATVSDNSYVATGLTQGETYYVRLRPFDLFGKTGTNTSAEFAVTTKTGVDITGLSGWAYEIAPVDRTFIEANLAGEAIPSTKIENLTVAKLTGGVINATETITSEGVIRAVDDIDTPTVQTGIGPATFGTATTYLMWAYNGTDRTFSVDELGNVSVTGSITIAAGSTGVANLSDAGTLAGKNSADWDTEVAGTGKPANNADVTDYAAAGSPAR
jgi:hypothetical protein